MCVGTLRPNPLPQPPGHIFSQAIAISSQMAGTLQTTVLLTLRPATHPNRNRHFPATSTGLTVFRHISQSSSRPLIQRFRSISSPTKAVSNSDQAGGNGDLSPGAISPIALNWTKKLFNIVSDNVLPFALIGGVILGLANPSLGCIADKYYLSKVSTIGIFLISGLTLRSDEIGAAAEAWPVGIFGLASILLFSPFFSQIILQLKLQPQEFVTGLAIFCCMPTTLSSGVALTRLAGGNSALALAMTLMSSLLGILVAPLTISMLIASGVGVTVPAKQLFTSLVLTLLVPLILGKVLRELFKGLAVSVDENRKLLSVISALLLGLNPWIQVSKSSSLLLMVKPSVFLIAVGLGVLLHFVLLAFNALAIQGLSAVSGGSNSMFAKRENASALLLIASQKTLPVMVAVVEQLGGALGETGFLVLPCVAAHLNQIIFDSFLVSLWLKEKPVEKAKLA